MNNKNPKRICMNCKWCSKEMWNTSIGSKKFAVYNCHYNPKTLMVFSYNWCRHYDLKEKFDNKGRKKGEVEIGF